MGIFLVLLVILVLLAVGTFVVIRKAKKAKADRLASESISENNEEDQEREDGNEDEEQEEREINLWNEAKLVILWLVYFAFLSVISWGIGYGFWTIIKQFTTIPPKGYWIMLIGCIPFIILTIKTIIDGWTQIEQRWEWNVELFGKWIKTWKAGLHVGFPYLGFMKFKAVYTGEQQMKLFMDESKKAGYGYGDVEFEDASAPVDATIYFRIVDAKKATYDIENLLRAIEEKMDSAVRSYLSLYTLDEANQIKIRVHLIDIMNGYYVDPERAKEKRGEVEGQAPKVQDWDEIEKTLEVKCPLWKLILDNWGTKITGIAISDIVLTSEQKDARRKVLIDKRDAEAAGFRKEVLEKEGAGFASQVKLLNAQGVAPDNATWYLAERKKWENVGKEGATVIIDTGAGGIAGLGAQLGAGFKSAVDSSKTKDVRKEEDNTAEEAIDKDQE